MNEPDDVVAEHAPVAPDSPDETTPVDDDSKRSRGSLKRSLKSFFTSLPGMLTGLAGVATAVVAIAGLFIAKDGSVPFTGWPSNGTSETSSESRTGGPSGSSSTRSPSDGTSAQSSGSEAGRPGTPTRANGVPAATHPNEGGSNKLKTPVSSSKSRKPKAASKSRKPGTSASSGSGASPRPSTAPGSAAGTGASGGEPSTPVPSAGAPATTFAHPAGNRLSNDGRLSAANEDFLLSDDGRYRLVMQRDSDLVLYGPSGRDLWSSKTRGLDADHARMQSDGNLVIYDRRNVAIWETKTAGHRNAFLIVQNDGNVVIYADGGWIWASGTRGMT